MYTFVCTQDLYFSYSSFKSHSGVNVIKNLESGRRNSI